MEYGGQSPGDGHREARVGPSAWINALFFGVIVRHRKKGLTGRRLRLNSLMLAVLQHNLCLNHVRGVRGKHPRGGTLRLTFVNVLPIARWSVFLR